MSKDAHQGAEHLSGLNGLGEAVSQGKTSLLPKNSSTLVAETLIAVKGDSIDGSGGE